MTTGEKIAALRREKGLSQEALADALSISRQAVSKWEADGAAPSRDKLVELSAYFGVSVDALLRPGEAVDGEKATPRAEPPAPCGPKRPVGLLVWCGVLTAALLAALIWCGWLTGQLSELRNRVSGLGGTQTIVTQTAEPTRPIEITDYEIKHEYDARTNAVTLFMRVLPREHEEGETALLSLKGKEDYAVDAVWENGAYTGALTVPLEDDMTLYLVVTRAGLTRTIEIERLDNLSRQYHMAVSAQIEGLQKNDGRMTGRVQIACSPSYDRDGVMTNWLTHAEVEVYDGGEVVARSEADDPAEILNGTHDTDAQANENALDAPSFEAFETIYVYAAFDVAATGADSYFLVRYTDNYGRESTQRVEIP